MAACACAVFCHAMQLSEKEAIDFHAVHTWQLACGNTGKTGSQPAHVHAMSHLDANHLPCCHAVQLTANPWHASHQPWDALHLHRGQSLPNTCALPSGRACSETLQKSHKPGHKPG